MTDHFKPKDSSHRNTYRQALARILGEDRPLHTDNMGRYGPRQGNKSAAAYWSLATRSTAWWPNRVIVNVSDCIVEKDVYSVVQPWRTILEDRGYHAQRVEAISTPRLGFGANRSARVEHEHLIIALWRFDVANL
jgi:hypothetical protein